MVKLVKNKLNICYFYKLSVIIHENHNWWLSVALAQKKLLVGYVCRTQSVDSDFLVHEEIVNINLIMKETFQFSMKNLK